MKNILLLIIMSSNITFSWAQTQFGVGLNGLYATQQSLDLDVINATGGFFSVTQSFKLNKDCVIEPQLFIGGTNIIMDGIFVKHKTNNFDFTITPTNYKQSQLQLYYFKLPILLKYGILKDSKDIPFGFIGIGPYVDYIVSAQQYYKIQDKNFKENAPIQNKIQIGFSFELSLYGNGIFSKTKNPFSLHVGALYQLTDYIKDKSSFKPFMPYVRLGINL